ncbi:GntR family transcriptional regulator [Micromonospora sp. DR5-3]|uniref:GntR family transcriptional regulator n=1 Tax=unclassified Micromonospora TaxID=2617518 RepID=UPI0011D47608|nr:MULTISPECIES: GntR family transcriptional regulator [unclassified Micromonospora]MCW3815064.1 GntR family transcriptional regulator [Micromonospora sp. DR5-3]TYC25376.1 GntR family transcriptional regulator [Micromonospora sp. MP36]
MTMTYRRLTRDGSEPLWMQLMRELRGQIEAGEIAPDQPLPSEAELTDLYGVSRTVVREALRELVQQRMIYKVKGRGAFVAPRKTELRFVGSVSGSADDLRESGRRVTTHTIGQSLGAADQREADLLQIPAGEPVVRMRRLRRVDGQPWLLVDTALPARLVPGLERAVLENQSLYDVLRRRYGLEPVGADRWIEAVFPEPEDASLLEVTTSTPLLGIESVAWLRDGTRFEAYYALHRSDQTRFFVGIR